MFDAGLFPAVPGQVYPDNQSNRLYQTMVDRYAGIRDINQVSGILSQIGTGFNSGKIMKNWKMPVCWILLPNIS